jgi:medium-chain acyl-[acyl-carrier-protein] hydrolase
MNLSRTWVKIRGPRPGAQIRLFCLPHAGGGTTTFRLWPKLLGEDVEVCPVLLPGREERLMEPCLTDIADVIPPLVEEIGEYSDKPFAIFGHSLGGLLAWDVVRRLEEQGGARPVRTFLGAVTAVRPPPRNPLRRDLSDQGIVDSLRELDATDLEFYGRPELVKLLLPTIRADAKIAGTFDFEHGACIEGSLTVFGGAADHIAPPELVEAWRTCTTGEFRYHLMDGDHFFLHDLEQEVTGIVRDELMAIVLPGGPGSTREQAR